MKVLATTFLFDIPIKNNLHHLKYFIRSSKKIILQDLFIDTQIFEQLNDMVLEVGTPIRIGDGELNISNKI